MRCTIADLIDAISRQAAIKNRHARAVLNPGCPPLCCAVEAIKHKFQAYRLKLVL